MILGSDYIYECPNCGTLLKRGSLISGNDFRSTLYSDRKLIAPMLPDFPNLTKCKKCKSFLWLDWMKKIGTDADETCKPEWKNADSAEFLDIEDLFHSLRSLAKTFKETEKAIRTQIWWAYNDRIREGKEIFVKEDDEDLWKKNCQRLIALLDKTDFEQKFMIAELYRNLGEFDACMEIINSLGYSNGIVERFTTECNNRNKSLIKLEYDGKAICTTE